MRKICFPKALLFSWMLCFGIISVAAVVLAESLEVVSVTAAAHDEILSIQPSGAGDEGRTRGASNFPVNPEEYAPLPLPEAEEDLPETPPVESLPISYEISTGAETPEDIFYQELSPEAWEGGRPGAGGKSPKEKEQPQAEQRQPLNFSNLTPVPNPEDDPWRVNAKIFIDFSGPRFVASAVLIDPMHALTAGHCVHEIYYGGWAESIVVIPAYDNGSRPYGDASSVELHAWSGWTMAEDYDHDIGVIYLDRPVGALTGWHGYGYNDTPSFYTGNTFYNPGYPAQSPYNGKYMYYWYGPFDFTESNKKNWYGNEIGINRVAYGGQSGSGAYFVSDEVVYAVLSSGTSTKTYFPRITSDKVADIYSWIDSHTPPTCDFIPLDVTVSPVTAAAGSQLSSLSYLVHNYSSASWNGTVDATVYISNNNNISTTDIPIQTHSFPLSLNPKCSARVNVNPPPTIPLSVSPGAYYVGVILDISDYDTGNNESDGQDAAPITVTTGNNSYSISGTVDLACPGWSQGAAAIAYQVRSPGLPPTEPLYSGTITVSLTSNDWTASGTFIIPDIPNGTYDVALKHVNHTADMIPQVVIAGADVAGLELTLWAGDSDGDDDYGTACPDDPEGDNDVDLDDYYILTYQYHGTVPLTTGCNADFDADGDVDLWDYYGLAYGYQYAANLGNWWIP